MSKWQKPEMGFPFGGSQHSRWENGGGEGGGGEGLAREKLTKRCLSSPSPPCTTVQWPPELCGPILTVGKCWGRDSSVPPALSVTPATLGYRRFLASISHPGNGINPFTPAAGKKTLPKGKKKMCSLNYVCVIFCFSRHLLLNILCFKRIF